jgi:hypothetical protein
LEHQQRGRLGQRLVLAVELALQLLDAPCLSAGGLLLAPSQLRLAGAILRREGLYSSHITKWKRQRDESTLVALASKKRGRKPDKDPTEKENERLRQRVAQLERKLETAELIIDVQKKVSQLLGIPLATSGPSEKS